MKAVFKLMAACLVLFAVAALIAVPVLFALGRPQKRAVSIEQRQAAEGVPVAVTRPRPMEFREYVYCDGQVVADVRAMLRAKVEEVVEAVNARVGEPVRKGQVLVEFRKADLAASVQAAETAFREAENTYARYVTLAEQQVIAQDRLEQAKTAREAAAAALEAARSRLKFAELASPIDGYVDVRWVEPGEFKSVGNELLSIVDLTTVEVLALVADQDVSGISEGADVEFQLEAGPQWLKGRVDRISPATEDPNRFFEVFLKVENRRVNGNWLMRPGMYAEVRFMRRAVADALGVPASAVSYEGNDQVIYAVEAGKVTVPVLPPQEEEQVGFRARIARGLHRVRTLLAGRGRPRANPDTAEQREIDGAAARRIVVKPGLSSGDYLQVSDSGLTAETVVILNPRDDLRDGTFVRVVQGGESA